MPLYKIRLKFKQKTRQNVTLPLNFELIIHCPLDKMMPFIYILLVVVFFNLFIYFFFTLLYN